MEVNYISVLLLMSSFGASLNYEHKISKRFLVFPRGGIFKIVIGIVNPVKLGTKQSMGIGWNFQFQYQAPTNATQLVNYPPIYTGKRSIHQPYYEVMYKNDRALFYQMLEETLNSEGLRGRECLLKSICENAMEQFNHESNGLYGQIIHIILTPSLENEELDSVYLEAQKAGEYGVECDSLFTECGIEGSFLNLFSTAVPFF